MHGPGWARRETLYNYEQGANGVLKGDLYYYSVEHDYLTNPDDAREAAEAIGEGATVHEMKATGHFPMAERPELFRAYLKPVLDDIRGVSDEPLPEVLTPEEFGVEANK